MEAKFSSPPEKERPRRRWEWLLLVLALLTSFSCVFCSTRLALRWWEEVLTPASLLAQRQADYHLGNRDELKFAAMDPLLAAQAGTDVARLYTTPMSSEGGTPVTIAQLPFTPTPLVTAGPPPSLPGSPDSPSTTPLPATATAAATPTAGASPTGTSPSSPTAPAGSATATTLLPTATPPLSTPTGVPTATPVDTPLPPAPATPTDDSSSGPEPTKPPAATSTPTPTATPTATSTPTATPAAVQISGLVFEDVDYSGGSGSASGGSDVGLPNVRVELYNGPTLVDTATTDASGFYTFANVPNGSYSLRVVSAGIGDSDTPPAAGFNGGFTRAVAEQTYESDGIAGNGSSGALGGNNPWVSDLSTPAGAGVGDTNVPVTLSGLDLTGVDFGFSYRLIVNTQDGDQGSLRQFLLNANAVAGGDRSIFYIPPSDPNFSGGVATISPATVLPALTDAGTILDGTTQTGNGGDTNPGQLGAGGSVGVDGLTLNRVNRPEVQIVDGPANLDLGLAVKADNVTVRGIAIYGFGNHLYRTGHGNIHIGAASGQPGSDISGILIEESVLGSSAAGFTDPGSGARGLGANIHVLDADNGTVRNNLIGFSESSGLSFGVDSPGSITGWVIENNEIRENALGRPVSDGISIHSQTGSFELRGNLIVENWGCATANYASNGGNLYENNTIRRNGIGNLSTTQQDIHGINLWDPPAETVRRNVIAENFGAGVYLSGDPQSWYQVSVPPADRVRISQNSFYDNGTITNVGGGGPYGQIGLDLDTPRGLAINSQDPTSYRGTAPFVTMNDAGDGDSGPNELMNFPVLYNASLAGGNVTITGEARPGAIVEFFIADPDSSGYGEGRTFIGSGTVSGSAPGTVDSTARQFSFSFGAGSLALGDPVTATATDAAGNTSEFALNVAIAWQITGLVFADMDYNGGSGTAFGGAPDTGLPNVEVQLYNGPTLIDTATTDSSGRYTFHNLTDGAYTGRVVSSSIGDADTPPAGVVFEQTYEHNGLSGNGDSGAMGGDDPATPDDTAVPVTVSGANVSGVDFGFAYNVVVNTNDSNQGSLRQAIDNTNMVAGTDTIVFNVAPGGVQTIALNSDLPSITESVEIDGSTQPNFVDQPLIVLSGAGFGGSNGLHITAGSSRVQGLVVNGFSNYGIWLDGGDNNTIQGNFIGTDQTGTAALANRCGLVIENSADNIIGGTAAGDRNLISGNSDNGLHILGSGATGNVVQGNYVGPDLNGAIAGIGNGINGIRIAAASANTIGGSGSGEGNLVIDNRDGIDLDSASGPCTNNRVDGNSIHDNRQDGIDIGSDNGNPNQNNQIVNNQIYNNRSEGVEITGADSAFNTLSGNSIYNNNRLGIDLGDDGITPNDGGDGDSGPNELLNFPVIYTATLVGGNVVITGETRSGATVEFFIADPDPTGYGESQTFIGSFTEGAAEDSNGASGQQDSTAEQFEFSFVPLASLFAGDRLTATASKSGSTSEFAQNVIVN